MVVLLKRLRAPIYWKIERKKFTWAVTPRAGPHPKNYCIPLLVLVRDILKFAETGKEAKRIIKRGDVFVDGKPRKDHKYPTGLFDVVSFPKINKHYRIIPFEKGLKIVEIDEGEANRKICRIKRKVKVKGGKIQLTFHDGKTLLTQDNKFKPYDSVLIELPSLKILEHLPFSDGMIGIVVKGKVSGKIGKIEKIIKGGFNKKWEVEMNIEGRKRRVIRDYVFVVGRDNPLIKIGE